jgi:hypothetical protein
MDRGEIVPIDGRSVIPGAVAAPWIASARC